MKILIAFYSLTGNTKKIARAVTGAAGGEVMEIKIKREIPEKGFWRYFWIGMQAIMRSGLRPLEKNPNDYDLIFLGGPVWAGNFAPAIRSFLEKTKLKNKKSRCSASTAATTRAKQLSIWKKNWRAMKLSGRLIFKWMG